jgi:hypothetical protein
MIQAPNSAVSAENARKTAIERSIGDKILPVSDCYFSKESPIRLRGLTAEFYG